MHYGSNLRIWFDRDISIEVGSDLSADIVSLLRLVTSRSNERLNEGSRITGKQSVKLTVVERPIDGIGRDTTLAAKSAISALDKYLNTSD